MAGAAAWKTYRSRLRRPRVSPSPTALPTPVMPKPSAWETRTAPNVATTPPDEASTDGAAPAMPTPGGAAERAAANAGAAAVATYAAIPA